MKTNANGLNDSLALAPRPVGLDLEPFDKAEAIAVKLAKSSLLPSAVRGKPADLAVILITGHELGLSAMQSLRGIHVVEGRPTMAADLLVGLVKKHPACRYFRLVESTDERAEYETLREGEPEPTRIVWTIQQATKASLTGRANWKAHPAAMLRARASAALARAVYPDVALGIYDEDEAMDFIEISKGVQVEVNTKAPEPPKATRAPKAKPAPEPVEDAVFSEPEEQSGAAEEESTEEAVELDEIEETWLVRISEAADTKALQRIGEHLIKRFPIGEHPMRLAMRQPYAERQRALREAQR